MKRILSLSLVLFTLVLAFSSCNNDKTKTQNGEVLYENPGPYPTYSNRTLSDHITLPSDYATHAYKKDEIVPSEKKLEDRKVKDFAGKVTDRAAKNGDTVNIDYVGKKDGVAFDGGTAKGSDLELGSGKFIPVFEEGLVGVTPGQTVDIPLTFPKEYHAPDLAGKAVVFTVTVNYIKTQDKTIPTLTDELVQKFTSYKTAAEYEKGIYDEMYNSALETAVWDYIFNNSTYNLPPEEVQYYITLRNYTLQQQAQSNNMTLTEYIKANDTTKEKVDATTKEYAENAVKTDLVIYRLAEILGITAQSEGRTEALQYYFDLLAPQYGFTSVEDMSTKLSEDIDRLVTERIALQKLCKSAVLA